MYLDFQSDERCGLRELVEIKVGYGVAAMA